MNENLNPPLKIQARVLVTGGAGFLGAHLVRALSGLGHSVRVLDSAPIPEHASERVERVQGDVRDSELVSRVAAGVDYIVHCVAVQPVSRSRRSVFKDVNVMGTRNVLEAARHHGVRRVVHVSSSAVYGLPRESPITEATPFNPICDYGRSKVASERLCRRFRSLGQDVVILRPRVLLGQGRLGVYHLLFNWIADGKPVFFIGSGDRPFQALAVQDLVSACLLALFGDTPNQDFNLGAAEYQSFRGDVEGLLRHARSRKRIVPVPAVLAKTGLWALDVLDLSPLTAWHYLTADAAFFFDCSKAEQLLGWKPAVSNIEMLCESYDWYVANRRRVDPDVGTTHTKSLAQRAFRLMKVFA
ncbi:MAG TPA: NAD(P)-dependent oxidoreductase [Polyangiaceae bacterium]|nr:NAD(P)-dependent oxidoreductase [Polyangiaceae bacterium]